MSSLGGSGTGAEGSGKRSGWSGLVAEAEVRTRRGAWTDDWPASQPPSHASTRVAIQVRSKRTGWALDDLSVSNWLTDLARAPPKRTRGR